MKHSDQHFTSNMFFTTSEKLTPSGGVLLINSYIVVIEFLIHSCCSGLILKLSLKPKKSCKLLNTNSYI